MRSYSCDVCIYARLYEEHRRTCFKYEVFPCGDKGKAEGDWFEIPRFTPDGKTESDPATGRILGETRLLDEDRFLDVLFTLQESLPTLSAFQILQAYFREVCPTAFVDEVMASLLTAQNSCSEYKLDISKEEIRTELLGFYMTLGDVLEAFDIIQTSRNAYERYEAERIENQNKAKK